ncbi:MAG TPA: glycosyltransferase family 4 protein [Acidimicrobiales bacterium]
MPSRRAGSGRIAVRLTVPHLDERASPSGEVRALARHLPRDEFDLTICSLRADGVDVMGPWLEGLGHRVVVSRFRPRGRSARHLRAWIRDTRELDRQQPCDVQHSLDFTSSPLEALAARVRRVPFVFSQRNMAENSNLLLLRAKGRLARGAIAISPATARLLRSVGLRDRRLHEVANGVDRARFEADSAPDPELPDRYLLLVSNVQRRKRIQDAVAALALRRDEHPDQHLVIAGGVYDEGYRAEIDRQAASGAVGDRVHFVGSRHDVPRLMRHAEALVHCSESEGFGWILIEAMAAGLPVITSANEGATDIVTHDESGLVVAIGQVDGYAEAVRRLADEPGLRERLVAGGHALVARRFSAEHMAQGWAQVYRSLAPARSPRADQGDG